MNKTGTAIVLVIGGTVVALLIFHAGVSYGERAVLGRLHGTTRQTVIEMLPHGFIPEGHGAVGVISSVTPMGFMLLERDGDHEQVMLSSSTIVNGPTPSSVLLSGEQVIVIGDPNEKAEQMTARFVRIIR